MILMQSNQSMDRLDESKTRRKGKGRSKKLYESESEKVQESKALKEVIMKGR